ncbi:MAG: nitrilase-related carbon-nitrogen hydrolase, partial [Candidatus Baltobacteraceae bacterium]
VPFVEQLPAPGLLEHLPGAQFVSRFRSGRASVVVPIGNLRVAALICWESAFDDLAHVAVAAGAQVLLVATDDAWFGTTAGPYQHAQIAQMRALETGTWIVRAAATGISGIIAPNGRYVQRTTLQHVAIVSGAIGPPAPTLYARLGAYPIALLLILAWAFPVWKRR